MIRKLLRTPADGQAKQMPLAQRKAWAQVCFVLLLAGPELAAGGRQLDRGTGAEIILFLTALRIFVAGGWVRSTPECKDGSARQDTRLLGEMPCPSRSQLAGIAESC